MHSPCATIVPIRRKPRRFRFCPRRGAKIVSVSGYDWGRAYRRAGDPVVAIGSFCAFLRLSLHFLRLRRSRTRISAFESVPGVATNMLVLVCGGSDKILANSEESAVGRLLPPSSRQARLWRTGRERRGALRITRP